MGGVTRTSRPDSRCRASTSFRLAKGRGLGKAMTKESFVYVFFSGWLERCTKGRPSDVVVNGLVRGIREPSFVRHEGFFRGGISWEGDGTCDRRGVFGKLWRPSGGKEDGY